MTNEFKEKIGSVISSAFPYALGALGFLAGTAFSLGSVQTATRMTLAQHTQEIAAQQTQINAIDSTLVSMQITLQEVRDGVNALRGKQ
jgi:hypothetical protein